MPEERDIRRSRVNPEQWGRKVQQDIGESKSRREAATCQMSRRSGSLHANCGSPLKRADSLPLAVTTDCEQYLADRLLLLAQRLDAVMRPTTQR